MHRETLESSAQVILGPEHPSVILILDGLASLAYLLGNGDEAEEICRELVEQSTAAMGVEDPSTLKSLDFLELHVKADRNLEDAE